MIHSDKILARKIERAEGQSTVACIEARKKLYPERGAEWMETGGGVLATFDGIESPLTQTFGLGVFDEITAEKLDEIEAFFKTRNAPVLHEVSPMADASLLNLLNERGYQPVEHSSVLYRRLNTENQPDLKTNPQIKTRLIEKGEEEIWARTSAKSWATVSPEFAALILEIGLINAHSRNAFPFVGELAGEIISTGMLYIHEAAALLSGAGTIPERRNQGGQTAMLAARLNFAAAQGCKIAAMGALPGSISQRNAEKNGFLTAYTRTKWQLKI